MQFRYARHTNDLKPIVAFYTEVIGLEILGHFDNHDHYNGVFLGYPHNDWHLEFTESNEKANHQPDPDDLLVFYVHSQAELNAIRKDAEKWGSPFNTSKNPYWQRYGMEIQDPDQYGVILSLKQFPLIGIDADSELVRAKGLKYWDELIQYVQHLPYGRNANRQNFSLVLQEEQGTCSSKHALLKQMADANKVPNVELMLGLYKMTSTNTPGLGNILSKNGLDYIPEAHCYLKINNKCIDLTNPQSNIHNIIDDLLEERLIVPSQVGSFKVSYHRNYLRQWLVDNGLQMSFEKLWKVREDCIEQLSKRANLK